MKIIVQVHQKILTKMKENNMKNKALTLTIVAKMTSNYGEGLGNIGSV